jgi:outer membrane biosynthesis protein TonB
MPTYVRMPEPETTNISTGGIPPRAVREASPLAVPGGERAWLPFAFGALVLLLCAVVLFFGVRGLPQFSGGTAGTQPTEEATEEVTEVLPTETVIIEPTEEPEATEEPTEEPQPTPEPQPVKATTTDVLNIRQGPARTTPSLGKLQKGQEVTVVGRNGDGTWLQIEIPADIASGLGWVSAEFVTVTGDINTLPVASGDSGANPQPTETPTG